MELLGQKAVPFLIFEEIPYCFPPMIHWTRVWFPKYIKNSSDSTPRQRIQLRNGQRPKQTLLQGGHTADRQTYKRMLSITRHQRDTNWNQNEISSHTSENGHHKQINKQQVVETIWRKGNSSTLLVGMQTGVATVEMVWNFFKKLNMEPPFDPAIPLLRLYPKSPETPIQKNLHPNVHSSLIYNSHVLEIA